MILCLKMRNTGNYTIGIWNSINKCKIMGVENVKPSAGY